MTTLTPTPEYITEIVGRLRRYQFGNPGQEAGWPEMGEFADLIEVLAAQLSEARAIIGCTDPLRKLQQAEDAVAAARQGDDHRASKEGETR